MVVSGRNEKELVKLVAEIKKDYNNYDIEYKIAEATNEQDAKELVKFTMEKFGRIDILVLAAGVSYRTKFSEMNDMSLFKKAMDINLMGYVYLMKAALDPLKKVKGQVVVLSSVSGIMGTPLRSPYCATKFAVNGFFSALRLEEPEISFTLIYPPTVVGTNFRNNTLTGAIKQMDEPSVGGIDLKRAVDIIVMASDRKLDEMVFPTKIWLLRNIDNMYPPLA